MGNLTAFASDALELRNNATEEDLQSVIRGVYRQVLGNQHVMESNRLDSAESYLRNGSISVRGFVRAVAKSSLYRALFFEGNSQYRFIELNFKHLLGRAPQDQSEIAEHVKIYNEQGYEAEIDSYINSVEYVENFGEAIVPFPRSISSQVGIKNEGFNRMFALLGGYATNDQSKSARLLTSVAANLATAIKSPAGGSGAYANTGKRFQISFSAAGAASRLKKFSKQSSVVTYGQMSQAIQAIHKAGGKIASITEVA